MGVKKRKISPFRNDPTLQPQLCLRSISEPIDIRANEAIDGKVNDLGMLLEGGCSTAVYFIPVSACFCSVSRVHGPRTTPTSRQETGTRRTVGHVKSDYVGRAHAGNTLGRGKKRSKIEKRKL